MVLAATGDGEDEPPPRMRLSDYSPEVALLSTLNDRIAGVAAAIVAAAGVKPSVPKPMPRPETAVDRRRGEQRVTQHRSLVAALLPSRAPEGGDPGDDV